MNEPRCPSCGSTNLKGIRQGVGTWYASTWGINVKKKVECMVCRTKFALSDITRPSRD
jgi:hypothetical protein